MSVTTKMDRILTPHKHGVNKKKKSKQLQQMNKHIRYFSEEKVAENALPSKSLTLSSSEKKNITLSKVQFADTTKKLLAVVAPSSNLTHPKKSLSMTGKGLEIIKSERKSKESSLSQGTHSTHSQSDVTMSQEVSRTCVVSKKLRDDMNHARSEHNNLNSNSLSVATEDRSGVKQKENTKKSKTKKKVPKDFLKREHELNNLLKIDEEKKKKKRKKKISSASSDVKDTCSSVPYLFTLDSSKTNSSKNKGTINQEKSKKNSRKSKFLGDDASLRSEVKEVINDKAKLKELKTPKHRFTGSVAEGLKHLSNLPSTSNEFSMLDSNNGILKPISEVNNIPSGKSIVVSKLPSNYEDNEFTKPCKKSDLKSNVSVQKKTENHMSGNWDVLNFDMDVKKTIPIQRKRKSDIKKMVPDVCSESMVQLNSKQKQQMDSISSSENGKIEETVVSGKKLKTQKELKKFHNSSPIIIEMSGNHVTFNPIQGKEFALKRQNVASGVKLKNNTNWKLPKTCMTDKWEVKYGNVEQEHGLMIGDTVKRLEINSHENSDMTKEEHEDNVVDSIIDISHRPYCLYDISETEAILTLPPSHSVFLAGAVKVRVLIGKISVLGYEMSTNIHHEHNVYSPYGMSHLSFQECGGNNTYFSAEQYWMAVENAFNIVKLNPKLQEKIVYDFPKFSTVLLLQCMSDTLIPFLSKYLPVDFLPTISTRSKFGQDVSGTLRAMFVDPSKTKHQIYTQPSTWNSFSELLMKRPPNTLRLLACGGKGVGKSTFLRFLTNRLLSKYKEVLYIDFDPGQGEFSISGSVCATVVKNPLLGPNYTHLSPPDRMVFVGENTVANNFDTYLQSVQYIFDWCCSQTHFCEMPWLINTMGYVKNFGVDLAVTVIKMVNPSDVVQIQSLMKERNFAFLLTPDQVENHKVRFSSFSYPKKSLNYTLEKIPSVAENSNISNSPWGMKPNLARNVTLISYFCSVIAPPTFSLLEAVPYILPFSGLKLCVYPKKLDFTHYLAAMNANLVALCDARNVQSLKPSDPDYPEIVEKTPVCNCYGYGIVRGVDIEKKIIFIISPITSQHFKLVNCLVLGAIYLPEEVYTSQDEAVGAIPYVTHGINLPLGKMQLTNSSLF